MLKKILLGLVAVIALILIVAAFQPNQFSVQRSLVIAAPPAVLFDQVNDHRKFAVWNPWMKLDPNVKTAYSGPATGVGSVASWQGNREVGAGSATIIESKPGELVRQRMDWKEPMEGASTVDFIFKPEGAGTLVTWHMYGPNSFVGKVMCLFMSMDKMVGGQFEVGLANLKAIAEGGAKK
ncbi:MAG: SRPBCC family protein [Opitutaceae bacterium]|nr:SRPBCC family protein [Opitutaceae bacterium]